MRISHQLLPLLFISLTTQSQIPAVAVAPEDVAFNATYSNRKVPAVTGKLLNISAAELKTLPIIYAIESPFSLFPLTRTTFAKPDGSFRLELDNALPYQQIWISVDKYFFAGICANSDLFLELDMKKLKAANGVKFIGDGVSYLGTDGALNVYMNNYIVFRKTEQDRLSSEIYGLDMYSHKNVDSVVREYNVLSDSVRKILGDYIAEHPSLFGWILENERMTVYYANLCAMYFGKTMDDELWQKINHHKSYVVSSNSTQFYNSIITHIESLPGNSFRSGWKEVACLRDLNTSEKAAIDSLKSSDNIQQAYPYTPENIKKWIDLLEPRIQKIALARSIEKNIQEIDSVFSPAKADYLKLGLNRSTDLNEQKLALEQILISIHTDWCGDVLKREYKRLADKVNDINRTLATSAHGTGQSTLGKPLLKTSFGATFYKTSDIKSVDFLAKIKKSFPGKAIIIDRWGTWCIPCISEMPRNKKLQESSKDLPVVFVYLCTLYNSTEIKWKTKVVELEQPGIHILISKALDIDLSSYFSFNGYPGYALIDKEGNYRRGAFQWLSEIENREMLAALINK